MPKRTARRVGTWVKSENCLAGVCHARLTEVLSSLNTRATSCPDFRAVILEVQNPRHVVIKGAVFAGLRVRRPLGRNRLAIDFPPCATEAEFVRGRGALFDGASHPLEPRKR